MGWKLALVATLVVLWVLWPKIRIPKDNFLRRKLGIFATYLLLIVSFIAFLQFLDYLVDRLLGRS
jgi:hypothetical protein